MFNSNASAVSGDVNYIEDVFSTWLYPATGPSAGQTITNNIDLSTKGGMVWIKNRTDAGAYPVIVDTARGANKWIYTSSTAAQATSTSSVTSFNTNGFTLGTDNGSGDSNSVNYAYSSPSNMVSWTFREQAKFFDVVTYTGNGTTNDVAHALASVPGFVVIKKTSTTSNWYTLNRDSSGNYVQGYLNTTGSLPQVWVAANTSTYLTSTTLKIASLASVTGEDINASGVTYVAYVFAHNAGGFGLTGTDNVISCGSYTGTGATQLISVGFEPQWILIKNATSANDWRIVDNMRGFTATGNSAILKPNTADAETSDNPITIASTGFYNNNLRTSGNDYIYVAIRRGPMKVPTDGTKVFNPSVRASGTGAAYNLTGVGFPPDLLISSERTSGVLFAKGWHDRLRGNVILISNSANNEAADSTGVTAYGQDGFSFGADGGFATVNYSGSNYVYEALRRAPSFFDEVCYAGNAVVGRNVSHNLAAIPELMIVKGRSIARAWFVYSATLGATKYLKLNATDAQATGSSVWNDTAPTSSVFTLGGDFDNNYTGYDYVAYLFATCAGVSKVGSYTGTATTQQINCGFTAGARFVMIKRTDSTGDWYVWDSARGIVSGNDPYFLLNTNAAEVTSTDYVDTYAAGFELSSTAPAAINASGGSYIFLAIA